MSPYAAAHVNPQGPGDARPTALQIIKDEGVEGKLVGKVIVITGTSSGLGVETVRALSTTGATLFLTARNLNKAKTALEGIFEPGRMHLIEMDQGSLDSVRAAAAQILSKTDKVNILINNAGIMAVQKLEYTKDGYELQFGTNHLSHFLFFMLLKRALLAAATPDFSSRVVNVSSTSHVMGGINASDNYNFEKGSYDPWVSYAQSKTANIYMANEINRRYQTKSLYATSLHPGGIMTSIGQNIPEAEMEKMGEDPDFFNQIKSPAQGAATTVWAAVGKEWAHKGGGAKESKGENPMTASGYAKHAYDAEEEARLWKDSLKLVGLA
ncbi:hypothetical protein Neosp_013307 [[Neocosmospora] mangrovei]